MDIWDLQQKSSWIILYNFYSFNFIYINKLINVSEFFNLKRIYFMNEITKIVLLSGILVSSLIEFYLIIKVSFSDPGIVVRGDLSEREFEKYVPIAVINNKNYILKYCSTCEITKDLRVFHCSSCDACIVRHGKYNIKF